MKDIVMVGTGDFSDWVADMIENDLGRTLAGYVVDKRYLTEEQYRGKPVRAFEEAEKYFPPERFSMVIGFVGGKMYTQRYEKYLLLKEKGYELENIIHPTANISHNAVLGDGNIIFQFAGIAYDARVGACNVLTAKTYIGHNVRVGNANYFAPGFSSTGYVEVGSNCFLGVNSGANNKIKIADYTFVGGGVFLTHDTKVYDTYVPEKSEPLGRIRSIDFQFFASRRNANNLKKE